MVDINIASPGASEAAIRAALQDIAGWQSVSTAGAAITGPGWDQSVDGSAATVDFIGLAGARNIRFIMSGVSASVSGVRGVQVSVNNGSSFYAASGDYVTVSAAGTLANSALMMNHGTGTTAARTLPGIIYGAAVNGTEKWCQSPTIHMLFIASTLPINALRFLNSTGGNLTAGTITVEVD